MSHHSERAPRATIAQAMRVFFVLAILLNLFLNPSAKVSAAGGDVVTAFGTNGFATADPTSYADAVKRVIALPDGKILVGGLSVNGAYTTGDFAFTRLNADGTLDTTFGTNGYTSVSFGPGWSMLADMAVDLQGRIVAAGMYMAPGAVSRHFAVTRLCPNGLIDTGTNCPALTPKFGVDGKVMTQAHTFDTQNQSYAQAVALLGDDRIVAGGLTGGTGQQHRFALVRYETDGSPDMTFDNDGVAITEMGVDAMLTELAEQADGKIVAAGTTHQVKDDVQWIYEIGFGVARYNDDGTLDTSFSGDGKTIEFFDPVLKNDGVGALAIDGDGRILVGGNTYTDNTLATDLMAVARLCPDGSLDDDAACSVDGFGGDGRVILSRGEGGSAIGSITRAPDGHYIAGGRELLAGANIFSLVKLDSGDIDGYRISGNAGVDGATLTYTDGTEKTVTSEADGSYSLIVSENWSGVVTPSKTGYTFSPASKTYTNVAGNLTGEDYTATAITYTISGSTGEGGVSLSYTDGGAKTATSEPDGEYSFTVSYDWGGIVTPSKAGFTFTPASRTYTHVLADQADQDYTPEAVTYTISGNTGEGGVTLRYTDGTAKTATSEPNGDYSFTVSYNWSGTVTPELEGFTFSPTERTYTNVLASQDSQDYTPEPITYIISGNTDEGGVTLTYTDGFEMTFTSDPDGVYNFSVPYNWSGTVTPSKEGFTFTPASRTYTNVQDHDGDENYTATPITYTISGNTGESGVTLTYTDGVEKTATSDSNGDYSFTVSYKWDGTVTPSKEGFTFAPASRDYTDVLADQTDQDFTPTAITFTISGNAGVAGATLSYTDGTAKTVTADPNGDYSFTVSYKWSGTVTPSADDYAFSPASRDYTDVLADQTDQDYTATITITYTISGNAGVGGATLTFVDGVEKTAAADTNGDYSIVVSYDWSGTVTPSLAGYTFSPASRSYTNVLANDDGEDYTATPITYTISGNTGTGGVTLTWTDGAAKTTTSDADGDYSITVSYNWSGLLTAAKTGYTFATAIDFIGVVDDLTGLDFSVSYDAPELEQVDGVNGKGFTLHWKATPGATEYIVDIATNDSFKDRVDAYWNFSAGTDTKLTVTGLEPNTVYYFRVRAVDGTLESVNSETGSVKTYYVYYMLITRPTPPVK